MTNPNPTDPAISAAIAKAKERRRFGASEPAAPMSQQPQASAPPPPPQPAPQPVMQPAQVQAPAPQVPIVNTIELRGQQVIPAPTPVVPEMSTLEKIGLLGSFANACKDNDIVDILINRPNGERLYEVFVNAVSHEIETIMNGTQAAAPKAMQDANVSAAYLANSLARFVQVFNAIEQGPGLNLFRMFVEQLGARLPPIPSPQQQQQPAPPPQYATVPAPQQPQQPQQPVPHTAVPTARREPRGENLGGSW